MMRLINTKAHGIYDYLLVVVLLNSPSVFDFSAQGQAYTIAALTALYILISALMTNFEVGLLKLIPIRWHFWMDGFAGAFLMLSPWLLKFHSQVYKPHFVFGLSMICVAILTDRLPTGYVRRIMSRARKEKEEKEKKKTGQGFQFIYSAGEEIFTRLLGKGRGSS